MATIEIAGPLMKKLKEYKEGLDGTYVFKSGSGDDKPVDYNTIGLWTAQVAKWAGLEKLHMGAHHLRHSLCGWLIDQKVPLEVTQDIMRHNNPSTTMGYYRLLETKKKDEVRRVLG